MLPGGYGIARHILAYLGWPGTSAFSPASRVSISELFGSSIHLDNMSALTYTPNT
jgi:hypothetical protein